MNLRAKKSLFGGSSHLLFCKTERSPFWSGKHQFSPPKTVKLP